MPLISHLQASRKIACPTCRAPAAVESLVYIDARLALPGEEASGSGSGGGGDEASIEVKGSYGTKVRTRQGDSEE